MTVIYFIRHSVRMKMSEIESYNSTQNKYVTDEKIILSSLGEERAKLLSTKDELQNIDVLYTSNCVRTLQTAKYLLEAQNLKVNIDYRLDERRTGKPNDKEFPDWFSRQYFDETFKTEGGESQIDVRNRVNEVVLEILNKYKGKRVAIFSHCYAITFYLLKYCKVLDVHDRAIKLEYNGKILLDRPLNAPEVFKVTFDDNNDVSNIELIEFDDLPLNHGI